MGKLDEDTKKTLTANITLFFEVCEIYEKAKKLEKAEKATVAFNSSSEQGENQMSSTDTIEKALAKLVTFIKDEKSDVAGLTVLTISNFQDKDGKTVLANTLGGDLANMKQAVADAKKAVEKKTEKKTKKKTDGKKNTKKKN